MDKQSGRLTEISFRVIALSILLAGVLALSNAYLALKIGLLTSASIPAAIISMGILRFFRNATILENNLVQTAASAGEAIAGGIVYSIPALIIIHYWTGFSYWQNFLIALLGGVLGIMASIPLRHHMMNNAQLKFPEGRAVAEVLKARYESNIAIRPLLFGSFIGALLELGQSGLKLLASRWEMWFSWRDTVIGFGMGFSPALLGAGYLIGFELAISILIGAVLGWGISVPILAATSAQTHLHARMFAHELWGNYTRYIAIGALLTAGMWTLVASFNALIKNIRTTSHTFHFSQNKKRTDKDMPFSWVFLISALCTIAIYFLYHFLFPTSILGVSESTRQIVIASAVFYTIIFGFIFSAIAAYFSGLVGVTASPGSAIVISILLLATLFLLAGMHFLHIDLSGAKIKALEAIVIITTSMTMGMAAISNDNMQDLKVGHLLGATPWKQQVMLLLGVFVSALIIPYVMQLLFNAHGIADVMPHAGMDPTQTLPAIPASAIAALSKAVFNDQIPWEMLGMGAAVTILFIFLNTFVRTAKSLSILGIAIGIYLPLSSSMPLVIGGLMAYFCRSHHSHKNMLVACGLVAGAAIMNVLVAIPSSTLHNPELLSRVSTHWAPFDIICSIIFTIMICAMWLFREKTQ